MIKKFIIAKTKAVKIRPVIQPLKSIKTSLICGLLPGERYCNVSSITGTASKTNSILGIFLASLFVYDIYVAESDAPNAVNSRKWASLRTIKSVKPYSIPNPARILFKNSSTPALSFADLSAEARECNHINAVSASVRGLRIV